jgi:hypothetical protein
MFGQKVGIHCIEFAEAACKQIVSDAGLFFFVIVFLLFGLGRVKR